MNKEKILTFPVIDRLMSLINEVCFVSYCGGDLREGPCPDETNAL